MPNPGPDNDITFVYVKELSDSIRSVSGVLQGLVTELHQHAITLHAVKIDVTNVRNAVDKLHVIIVDGSVHKPGLSVRMDDMERDVKDMRRGQEEERKSRDEDGRARKGFRYAIYVAIVTAVLGLMDRVFSYLSKPNTPPVGKAKP